MNPTVYIPPAELVGLIVTIVIAVVGGLWALFQLRRSDMKALYHMVKEATEDIGDKIDRLTHKVSEQNGRIGKTETNVEALFREQASGKADTNDRLDYIANQLDKAREDRSAISKALAVDQVSEKKHRAKRRV